MNCYPELNIKVKNFLSEQLLVTARSTSDSGSEWTYQNEGESCEEIALGSMAILTILILPIHEHGIFLHLFVSSLISFISDL